MPSSPQPTCTRACADPRPSASRRPGACRCHHCRPRSPPEGLRLPLFSRALDPPDLVLPSGRLVPSPDRLRGRVWSVRPHPSPPVSLAHISCAWCCPEARDPRGAARPQGPPTVRPGPAATPLLSWRQGPRASCPEPRAVTASQYCTPLSHRAPGGGGREGPHGTCPQPCPVGNRSLGQAP